MITPVTAGLAPYSYTKGMAMRNGMQIGRRRFLAAAGSSFAAPGILKAGSAPGELVKVGIMGMSRGSSLASTFLKQKNVQLAYACDADRDRAEKAADFLAKAGAQNIQPIVDFRQILDDKDVDILVVAPCNHWHAPAAILACAAGKHVYVEKPCSHNPAEGEMLVQASVKYDKRVQMGNQRRSWPGIQEAIQKVKEGAIGRAYLSKCFYYSARGSIGHGEPTAPPPSLDYELWQGPAARRPFRSNILHYNWHWFWHWGNGELGNNGVHFVDLARWGLDVSTPDRVISGGGRYAFQDDQETPDTQTVCWEFQDRKAITWDGLSCNPYRPGGSGADVVFYGEGGSLAISGGGCTIQDLKGKEIEKTSGPASDDSHIANFLAAVRGEANLNSPITEGHSSTLLCHLGNIAQRTGRALRCGEAGRIEADQEAMKLWSREYAPGWEPKV